MRGLELEYVDAQPYYEGEFRKEHAMMKKKVIGLLVILMIVVAPAFLVAGQPQNIILFGWDGAQRDHVNECLARNELPHLQELIDGGKYVQIDIEGKTDTKAGWSQILTGYYPEVTGVYSNGIYQPVPKGLSLFERLENHFGPDNFVTVAVIGKRAHCGEIDPPKKIRLDDEEKQEKAGKEKPVQPGAGKKPKGKIIEENGVKYRSIPGSPYYNMYTALEVWEFGLMQDRKVGARALELLEKYQDKPFFFFVHFAEVDHAGHKHGENSKEYNDAMISNDLWTGKIIEKVQQLGLGEKTQFYITADHGFNEDKTGHSFAPYVFLATNNEQVNRNGRRQDVAPTILEAFGLDVGTLDPPLDGISLTKPDDGRPPAKIQPFRARQAVKKPLKKNRRPDVIFVPTPQDIVDKMLDMAEVTKDDLVYDLGCGDGRIVVTAARKFGCKAVGYDIAAKRVQESRANVEEHNVGHLVRIEQEDIFTLDLSKANVITLYLLPSLNVKLIPQLEQLAPGSRIVSHDFSMRGVKPEQVVTMYSEEDNREHTIYLWRAPLNKTEE
jgi:hypothetical protein